MQQHPYQSLKLKLIKIEQYDAKIAASSFTDFAAIFNFQQESQGQAAGSL